jgi:phosphatidylserine/phosphatidylglycerophosphate/cardiolipin synthase-like enzyme
MNARLLLATAFVFAATSAHAGLFEDDAPPPPVCAKGASFETAFSPKDDVAAHVVAEILSAKHNVRVAAKTFVSKPVSEALLKAYRQGRTVSVVLDNKSNQTGYSASQFLLTMGVGAHITQGNTGLAGGYILIDDTDVILGNIAGLPDENDEKTTWSQVLIVHNAPELAATYLADWNTVWAASAVMKEK